MDGGWSDGSDEGYDTVSYKRSLSFSFYTFFLCRKYTLFGSLYKNTIYHVV